MTFQANSQHDIEEYYKNFIELQQKLRKSEEERLQLEMKFNEMIQVSQEQEHMYYKCLKTQYQRFVEEDRKRRERNENIMVMLERIKNRADLLEAKSKRLKLLRKQYYTYLDRVERERKLLNNHPYDLKQMDYCDDRKDGYIQTNRSRLKDLEPFSSTRAQSNSQFKEPRITPSDITTGGSYKTKYNKTNVTYPPKNTTSLHKVPKTGIRFNNIDLSFDNSSDDCASKNSETSRYLDEIFNSKKRISEISVSNSSDVEEVNEKILDHHLNKTIEADDNNNNDNSNELEVLQNETILTQIPNTEVHQNKSCKNEFVEPINIDMTHNSNDNHVTSNQIQESLQYTENKDVIESLAVNDQISDKYINVANDYDIESDQQQPEQQQQQSEQQQQQEQQPEQQNVDEILSKDEPDCPVNISDNNVQQTYSEQNVSLEISQNNDDEVPLTAFDNSNSIKQIDNELPENHTSQNDDYVGGNDETPIENMPLNQTIEPENEYQQYEQMPAEIEQQTNVEEAQQPQMYDEQSEYAWNQEQNEQLGDQTGQPTEYDANDQQVYYDENGQAIQYNEYDMQNQDYQQNYENYQQYDENGQIINYDQNQENVYYDENGQMINYDPNAEYQYEQSADIPESDDQFQNQHEPENVNVQPESESDKNVDDVMQLLASESESIQNSDQQRDETKPENESDFDISSTEIQPQAEAH